MTTAADQVGRPRISARLGLFVIIMTTATACATRGPDPAVMDSLAEIEIRMRLLQSDVTDVRQALAEREDVQPGADPEVVLQARLDDLQQRMAALPQRLAELCPEPSRSATFNAQCEGTPEVQRVVVSGDKLVVGQEERVWVDPPGQFLVAHVDAGTDQSRMHTEEVVEFERDGNKWVRFGITADEETLSVERPLKRMMRVDGERRAIVALRVQLGDVRETVEVALTTLPEPSRPLVLGRNFLTDIALVDVARKYVQPAFKAPTGQ